MNEILRANVQPAHGMSQAFAAQRTAFQQSAAPSYAERIGTLKTLQAAVLAHEREIVAALNADFGNRARQETQLLEIFPVIEEIRHIRRNLKGWMRPRSGFSSWALWPSRTRIVYQPLGVVGIIGPWNYPLHLTLLPLADALAAGNRVMIKPSEFAPATATLIARMMAASFPPEQVAVIEGGADVAAAFSALPFDHLMFTGSTRVGRRVMEAAAANLTPVTLELGGKSPALVHPVFPQEVAADRICSAKLLNAGQTCVAPDYVLVAEERLDAFVGAAQKAIGRRYPRLSANADYTHMINAAGWQRMAALVEDARVNNARIVQINPAAEDFSAETRVFPPTLILGAHDGMRVMQEEIFGPVLPVLTYRSIDEAIASINARPRPLALYYFDDDRARVREVIERTISGGVTINDCMLHVAQSHLPFGGVGPSGMGAYHGFAGFETFSRKKGVLIEASVTGRVLDRLLRPPYGRTANRLIRLLTGSSGK
jgi:coniferyl-aldehyde dehydrogenase